VQQVVEGLATGLSALDGGDEFLFYGFDDASEWLGPRLAGGCRLIEVPRSTGRSRRRRAYEGLARSSAGIVDVLGRLAPMLGELATPIPRSDGALEALGVDLVHFILPQAFLTSVPSIYQVHDLLHDHHPELFSPLHRQYRERSYSTFAGRASIVSTMTEWGRRDVCRWLDLPPSDVAVIPWAPAVGVGTGDRHQVAAWLDALPQRFLLYPAQTWPHKNHLRLLEALSELVQNGLDVQLVCSGHQTSHFDAITRRVHELQLSQRVAFVGYRSSAELGDLYRRATALIFPSRLEGWGLPVVEAFAAGLPVACSDSSVLPEVAGGAALLFDPDDTGDIARAMERIWTDDNLRSTLVARGRDRAGALSWEQTARTFRALYRKVAGVALSDQDRTDLRPPTLV
jgi:glycosyltransferase involved in cell wall biosynthesis